MIELAWPITALICFFGAQAYLYERLKITRYDNRNENDIIRRELTALKLKLDESETKIAELQIEIDQTTNDLNSIKLAKGFTRSV